jgi:hypothetical protein
MHYCRRNMLHQIYTNQISNDNIHQSTKTIFGDDNIHLFLCVAEEKVKNLCTWVPLFDAIAATTSWNVSWGTMCSFPHKQHNKWIPKSSIVWPHQHFERYKIVRCGILKWICSVVRKWMEDKRNERVLGRVNNQALDARPTQEWRCAHTTSKGAYVRSEVNSCSCNWPIK